ncbi:putative membrane protein [Dongia mobilis]|uniref:Putative membrane protein n=1 Tax=Dongia mobilis TaxID=578943 RepID=A0A4R6WT88_9PROT|nr:DUF2244 domain-containing protein [Dongia mobilis]TDQ82100.1 putative membrane protein [Dongia mobilis]
MSETQSGGPAAPHDATAETGEAPVFEAILYPHRSLGRRGYTILIAGTAIIMGLYGLTFLLLGAWPIFGFIGAEWLLFWYLFSRHLRGDRRAERLRLYADRLVIDKLDAKGRHTTLALQPYWLRVILKRAGEADSSLYLGSHGRAVEIGAFLSGPERCGFAEELEAVLARHRDGAHLREGAQPAPSA